jgi:hypothetical protein
MPDPTNLTQIQEEKAQEATAAVKFAALREVLMVLEPQRPITTQGLTYHALLKQLKRVIEAALAPVPPGAPAPTPSEPAPVAAQGA